MFDKKIVVETIRRCKEPVLLYCLFFLPPILQSRVPTGLEFNHPQFLLITTLTALFQILLVFYLLSSVGNRRLELYGFLSFQVKDVFWGIGGWIFLLILVGILSFAVQDRIDPPFQWRFFRFDLLPLLILALGMGAFFEELFFRGYLFQELLSLSVPLPGAFGITTLAFAAGHVYQGWWGIFLSFLLGTVLLTLRIRTGSLWAPTVAHGLYNLTVLLIDALINIPRSIGSV